MAIKGTYTALITPFKKDFSVDWDSLKNIVEFQVKSGIDGIVPMGTTGESPTLSHEEHIEVIQKVTSWAKALRKDIIIIAGTGSNSTREAIAMTRAAKSAGADYALVVNPYYNKPTQAGLKAHFLQIAEEGGLPMVLYNIPGRTCVKLELDTIVELSAHPNIVAIKEATGDINFMTQIILSTPEDFSLLSGDDNLLLPILSIGGKGVISVVSNLFPAEMTSITSNYLNKNYDSARDSFMRIFPVCGAVFMETNPIPVKYGASQMGLCEDVVRLPLVPFSKKHHEKFNAILKQFRGSL